MRKEAVLSEATMAELAGAIENEQDFNEVIKLLSKNLLERVLQDEMTHHLGYEHGEGNDEGNTRNGTSSKRLQGDYGQVELEIPRDRKAKFKPQIVKKHQRRLGGLDKKVLSLYAKGLSTTDIQDELAEMYGVEVSGSLISDITNGVMHEVKEWQNRPLESLYPVVYLDGIYVNMRVDGVVRKQTVYIAIAINLQGCKEVLGMWVGNEAKEGATFWLSVLQDIEQRGVEDVFIFCVDGLKGFPAAIEQVFSQAEVQLCIVHLLRNSMNFVPWKVRKEIAQKLKAIYTAATLEKAEQALEDIEKAYQDSYPSVAQLWRRNWQNIIPIFKYPMDIRKAIYTTNVIQSLNYTLKKSLKTKGSFPNQDSLMKVLYLALNRVSKKWTMPIRNWKKALNWFAQIFGYRLLDRVDTQNELNPPDAENPNGIFA